jgi:hypothetical protein
MLGLGALKVRLGIGGGFVSNPNLHFLILIVEHSD